MPESWERCFERVQANSQLTKENLKTFVGADPDCKAAAEAGFKTDRFVSLFHKAESGDSAQTANLVSLTEAQREQKSWHFKMGTFLVAVIIIICIAVMVGVLKLPWTYVWIAAGLGGLIIFAMILRTAFFTEGGITTLGRKHAHIGGDLNVWRSTTQKGLNTETVRVGTAYVRNVGGGGG